VPVHELSQVGEARRMATRLAAQLGWTDTDAGKVALAVTEAANNLVRHAKSGEIVLRALDAPEAPDASVIELLSIDAGPGMTSVAECLQDGYSTGGTSGAGLGAIRRAAMLFDLYSVPPGGTTILARFGSAGASAPPAPLRLGVVNLPVPGEEACGDAWGMVERSGRKVILLADGLGHGQTAADAAHEAVRIFRANQERTPAQIVEAAHAALRSTRGAAVAVAELCPAEREIRYAGVGNIAARIITADQTTHLVSHNGTVGHQMRRVQEFTYVWPAVSTLVMHSDGLSSQWRLDRYPGLIARHPGVVAGVLYRDFRRMRDDVGVIVAREGE
jgi:anti-sigma regulatory factor (Ser/Thr protein kinase)